MGMRIFLTGVTGYLGSVVAGHLARLPEVEAITGIARRPPTVPLPPKVSFCAMDMRSPELAGVMAGHEVVVHTAFIVLWPASMPAAERDDINLNGVRNVAQAALAAGVNRFVHASSVAAYEPEAVRGRQNITEDCPVGLGNSPIYYCNGKALAERALTEVLGASAMALSFLRPSYIIGPSDRGTVKVLRRTAGRLLGRDPRWQCIHEDDVAAAVVQAACGELTGAYNVVPDDSTPWSQMMKIVGVRFAPVATRPIARLYLALRWRYFGWHTHPSWLDFAMSDVTFGNAKLRGTGWQPRYTSTEALRTAVYTAV